MSESRISLEDELERLYDTSLRKIADFGAALNSPAGLELLRQTRDTAGCDILHGFLYGAWCDLPKECRHFTKSDQGLAELESYCVGRAVRNKKERSELLYDTVARFIGNCVLAHWMEGQPEEGAPPAAADFPQINVWINYSSILHSPMWDDEHPQRVLVSLPFEKAADLSGTWLKSCSYHADRSNEHAPWDEPLVEPGPIDLWYTGFVGAGVGNECPKEPPVGLRYDIPPSLHSVIHNHPREDEPILSSIAISATNSPEDEAEEGRRSLLGLELPDRDVAKNSRELSAHLFGIGKGRTPVKHSVKPPDGDRAEVEECVKWWSTIYSLFLARVLFPYSEDAFAEEREALKEVAGENAARNLDEVTKREQALESEKKDNFHRSPTDSWFTQMCTTKIHPDTQKTEDYGSLIVFCDQPVKGATLEHIRKSLWPVFSYLRQTEQTVIKNWMLIHFSRLAAVANAAPRNMSHHIGSHVIPRASVAHIRQRAITLGNKQVPKEGSHINRIVSKLKDSLDQYIRQKADFLAELPTEPANSVSTQYLYRDVLLPFLENTVLIDSLAANEGVRYRTWTDSALGIRLFVRSSDGKLREIRGRLNQEDDIAFLENESHQRFAPPYGLYPRWKPKVAEPVTYDIEGEEHDVSVAFPGGVGQFALYGILENLIRNAVKHNKERLGKVPDLEVSVVVDELAAPDADVGKLAEPSFYNLYILENLSDLSSKTAEGEVEIVKRLQDMLDEDIVNAGTGEPRSEHWGMAEIVMCGNLLAGSRSPINVGGDDSRVTTRLVSQGALGSLPADTGATASEFPPRDSLAYCFKILRAHRAVFCGPGLVEALGVHVEDTEGAVAWRRVGIEVVPNLAAFWGKLKTARATLSGYQFAVIEGTEADISDLRQHLPFRVIRIEPNADRGHVSRSSGDLVLKRLFADGLKWEPGQAEALTASLWETWCGRWLDASAENPSGSSIDGFVSLYLEESESEAQDSWDAEQERIDQFNKEQSPGLGKLLFRASRGDPDSALNKGKGTAGHRVFFDRHGAGISAISVDENDCYIPFDKKSEDFNSIFHPRFPSQTMQRHSEARHPAWTFPYELFEAGMLKVLVLDERICERSMTLLDRHDSTLRRAWGVLNGKDHDDMTPRMWHVAYRSNVFIATHVLLPGDQIRKDDRGEDHQRYVEYLRTAQPIIHETSIPRGEEENPTAPKVTRPSLTVELRDEAGIHVRRITPEGPNIEGDSTYRKREDIDVVVVHQGLIDGWAGALGGQEATLSALRRLSPWIIVESGRGMPSQVQGSSEKFLSYSALDRCFGADRVAKLALCRRIMERTRARQEAR